MPTQALLSSLRQHADDDTPIDKELALAVLSLPGEELPSLLAVTHALRRRHFGDKVRLCSIVNARSGLCGEDCSFCAQSRHYPDAPREIYAMLTQEQLVDAYQEGATRPIEFFSIVTSGGALPASDLETCIRTMRETTDGPGWCASLGCLDEDDLRRLKEAGMVRYHHNLETGRRFYSQVCTTHDYERRLETVRAAKRAGLAVCSGGIFGLGETHEDRVELAMTLAEEQVDSIALNFLIPIPGTPLEDREPMAPVDILKTVAMFRLTNPRVDVRLCGGRAHLRRMQSMLFWAGCNGMMIGDLLTTAGESVDDDLAMLRDLGLTPVR